MESTRYSEREVPAHYLSSLPSSQQSMEAIPHYSWQQQEAYATWLPSTSTEDCDLFPEILSWAALIESQTVSLPSAQEIPCDISTTVTKAEGADSDTAFEMPLLTSIFDATTLDYGFDYSCLEGLDDLLLYSPTEAYAAICWADAVHQSSNRNTLIKPPARRMRRGGLSPLVAHFSSNLVESSDSESDSDECKTYNDDYSPVTPIHDAGVFSSIQSKGSYSVMPKGKDIFLEEQYDTSFMVVEPRDFPIPEPRNSVGFFPIPTAHHQRTKTSTRIASFCANIPARLLVRTAVLS